MKLIKKTCCSQVENKRLQKERRCQSSSPALQPHWMDEEMGGAVLYPVIVQKNLNQTTHKTVFLDIKIKLITPNIEKKKSYKYNRNIKICDIRNY